MSTETLYRTFYIIVDKLNYEMTPFEDVIYSTLSSLKQFVKCRNYKDKPNRFKLFFKNDLSAYDEFAYSTKGLLLKIGFVENKSRVYGQNHRFSDDLINFLDEIGCQRKDGTTSLNRSKLRVDQAISEVIAKETQKKSNLFELELAIIRSIDRSESRSFTAKDLSVRTSIRPYLKDIEGVKTVVITQILEKILHQNHTIMARSGNVYFKYIR